MAKKDSQKQSILLANQDESVFINGAAPDYSSWMPMSMVTRSAAGAAALGAAGILALRRSPETGGIAGKALGTALLQGAAGAGAFAVYSYAARKAFSYEGKKQVSRRIIEGIAEHVRIPDGGVGLDIGCGNGALTIACAKQNPGAEMVGCDIWSGAYKGVFSQKVCENNARAEGVSNIRFEPGNAVRLPFADEVFDAVTSNYAYHNISGHNKQELLLETLRVLKKGGTFVIHDLMSNARCGDMDAFVRKLKDIGYSAV